MKKKIGFFIDYLELSAYQQTLFAGLEKAAGNEDIQLFVFNGGPAVKGPDGDTGNLNSVYDAFDPALFDGLLISTTLGTYINDAEYEGFLEKFNSVPIVFLGPGPGKYPQVSVDNRAGMEELINHFIYEHRYRKIAFVRGSEGHPDAEERFATYKACLAEAGIPYDDDYVVKGYFVESSGEEAVKTLLDERKLEVDAIICANDNMAMGVSKEMDRRGLTAPYDYALGGFDDIQLASSLFPGLTTVNQSIESLCEKGLSMLFDLIDGKDSPGKAHSPAKIVVRSTCGCPVSVAKRSAAKESNYSGSEDWSEIKPEILAAVQNSLTELGYEIDNMILEQLLSSGYDEVIRGVRDAFLPLFERYLRGRFQAGQEIIPVQDLLSLVRNALLPFALSGGTALELEDLVHHSRLIIEEVEAIRSNRARQELKAKYDMVINTGNALSNSISLERFCENASRLIPETGVTDMLIALYTGPTRNEAESTVYLKNGVRSNTGGSVFPVKSLLPPGTGYDSKILFICSIYNQEEIMGYMVANHIPGADFIIWNLLLDITRTLYTLLLIERVRDAEGQIRESSSKIETLIRPMLESIDNVRDISDEQHSKATGINTMSLENVKKVKGIFKQADDLQKTLKETYALVNSIDDISEKINIVALNASIQAAHAGSYGRGFAVIAGEVRKLSNSTGMNVKQINEFLQTIRSSFEVFLGVNRETSTVLIDLSEQISSLTQSLEFVSSKMDELSSSSNEVLALMK